MRISVIVGSRINASKGPRPNVSSITSLTNRSRSLAPNKSLLTRHHCSAARRTSWRSSSSLILPMAARFSDLISCSCSSALWERNRSSGVSRTLSGRCIPLVPIRLMAVLPSETRSWKGYRAGFPIPPVLDGWRIRPAAQTLLRGHLVSPMPAVHLCRQTPQALGDGCPRALQHGRHAVVVRPVDGLRIVRNVLPDFHPQSFLGTAVGQFLRLPVAVCHQSDTVAANARLVQMFQDAA